MLEGMKFYFAYGSNMLSSRMYKRIPLAQKFGIAHLNNKEIIFNKLGVDGSAKANIIDSNHNKVWGVIYKIPEDDLAKLDKIENNYERKTIICISVSGELFEAETYISNQLITDPIPDDWYKEIVVLGAEENNLPSYYIELLRKIPCRTTSK